MSRRRSAPTWPPSCGGSRSRSTAAGRRWRPTRASSSPTPRSSWVRSEGTLKLGDELLTPDSSRFWAADEWKPGGTQRYLDKQFLRDWSASLTGLGPHRAGPEIPDEVVEATRNRYIEVYERLTGDTWR